METQQDKITKLKPHFQLGPGDAIEEERNLVGLSQEELADILDVSLKHLNEIINNKRPLSFEICVLLSKVFNTSAEYWAHIDLKHRLHNSPLKEKDEEIKTKTRLYQAMPILELYKKKWLNKTDDFEKLKIEVADFWGMKSFDIDEIENRAGVELKTRVSEINLNKLNKNSLTVWHRFASTMADNQTSEKYNKSKLQELCNNITQYTEKKEYIKDFIHDLNGCGVKFIYCQHLQKTYLDGAVFIHKKNPVIGYTSRFNRLDNFWWTISHELGHIILEHLNNENPVIIDNNIETRTEIVKEEKEADDFAGELLKKDEIVNYFDGININEDRVINISAGLNLHPSIVVGILAHDGIISYVHKHRFNETVLDELEKVLN